MTSAAHRDKVISPGRYRRKTVGLVYSLQNTQSVPNSARLSSTPRSSSALDHRWVHRSQGDLTLDMDVHPRLQSEFYQELYQRYPHAFRRRRESREAGRKLFNSRLHVRFKDDAEFCDENHVSSGSLGNLHSNTHLTNWDREVGHYMKHKSRSRECITSVEPSECSGSVLSVTQRLRLNSQSLNKLLNSDSPLRKHFDREHVQYDSGTENEQSLQDYMLEKSKERSRHRKKQRRIIIQRNVSKKGSVDKEINKENEYNSRRWISKSVSPTRRHLFEYSLPNTNNKHEGYQVNVESLIANSDLKIDTLLGKISAKMSSPESPPDSAIDVDTPSVQSLVGTDTKGCNSGKSDSDLPVLNGQETGSLDSQHQHTESSPGSSASAHASKQCAKTSNDDIMQNPASNESLETAGDDGNEDILSVEVTTAVTKSDELSKEEEMNKIVEKYENTENLCQSDKPDGLLQLYTEDMGYNNVESSETAEELSDSVKNQDAPDGDHNDIKEDITKETVNEISTSCEVNTHETSVEARHAEELNVKLGRRDEDISTGEVDIRDESVNENQKVDSDEYQIQKACSDVHLRQEGSIDKPEVKNVCEDQEQEVDRKGDINTNEQQRQEAVTGEDQKLEVDITENQQDAFIAVDQNEKVDNSEDQKQEADDTEYKEQAVIAKAQKLETGGSKDSEKEAVKNQNKEAVIDEDSKNETHIDEQKKENVDEQQVQVSEINEQQHQASDVNEQGKQTTDIDEYQVKGTEEDQEQITDIGQCQKQFTDIDECQEQTTDIDECLEQITDIDDIPKLENDIDECPRSPCSEENIDYHADDEQEAEVVTMEIAQNTETVSKRMTIHRESDVDSGIGYSSAGTDMLPPRGRVTQRETNKKSQPFKAKHDILPLKSEVDVDILDEVNLVHLSRDLMKTYDPCARRGSSAREEKDDTDVRLGVTKPSERDRKLAEKYRRTRSPSPYILRNRQPSPGFRPESAPSFAQGETNVNFRVVDIPLGNETPESTQSAVHNRKKSTYQEGRPAVKSKASLKSNSCQNSDISKFSSMPNLPDNMSKHSNIYSANSMSSKLIRQRQCSVTSGSSISLLSESETDGMLRSSNATYVIDDYPSTPEGVVDDNYEKDMEEERFSEIELDSGTNIENLAERKQSELVRMIRGMNQPGTTSPRVKEKRLKIRNILKNRKGSYNPPEESGKHSDEKNIVNRIYAKVRGAVTGGSESVDNSGDNSKQKSVDVNNAVETGMTQQAVFEKNGSENRAGRQVPFESAISADKDTESVNQFISGASAGTVTAKPVVLSKAENDSETIKPDVLGDMDEERLANQDEIIGQSERSVSPTKALPPKKPVRNKNKNKNLNALAGQLNFSKYKIRVDEGLPAGQPLNWNAGKETDQSDQSPGSHDLPACDSIDEQSPTSPTAGQQPKLGRGSSHDTNSEIEEWQPLKSTTENHGNTTQKKRGSKGMFKFFKKSVSMDRGIETVGMDPNPTGQSSQESKEKSPPKVKKPPSLKSFTSIFSRKKKKKGQFIVDDVENASKRSSLSSNEQGLSNGKQQHYASCHSLETVGSSIQNQPIRQHSRDTVSSHQEFQPIGRLIKVNPDGTQVIQLYKPENGPIGFFIAKGNPKCGNGIFVSRFVENRPEQCFAGLLGIGDEIIEVNGHLVRDFSQDAVYSLISASAVVLVKVLPFIARKDV